MSKLTKREKILINLLIIVVVLYASLNFLILPAFNNLNDIKTQKENASISKFEMQSKINNLEAMQNNTIKTQNEIKVLLDGFDLMAPNEQVERKISDILLANNFTINKLTINDADKAFPQLENGDATKEYIKKKYVISEIYGSVNNLTNIMDYVNNLKSIRISYLNLEGNFNDLNQNINISIEFEVFMYENIAS